MKRIMLLGAVLLFASLGLVTSKGADFPFTGKFTNSMGMEFARIEPGSFVMGTGKEPPRNKEDWQVRDYDEAPAHPVKISKAFYLGIYEVTNAQYEQFDPKHKEWRGKQGISDGDNDPVAFVTWQEAVDFCAWLAKKEELPYRLPTEAEWEYACRAGTRKPYHTGDTIQTTEANLGLGADNKPLKKPVKVGSYKPNAWGLHDMHGNIAEWCLDWYGPYQAGEQLDPVGRETGYARVVRGWSYLTPSWQKDGSRMARSANRSGHLPIDANRCTGFRVALGPLPATKPLPAAELPLHQQDVKQEAVSGKRDPAKPYLVDFSKGKQGPSIAKDSFGPIFSAHNHYTGVCACPNGDILACWYTTISESGRELAQAASRLRAGADKWEPATLFFDVPDVNDHAPVLFRDGKRIYHFCTQSLRGWDDATDIVRYSDDSGATWSQPAIMVPRHAEDHLSQPCSAVKTKDGAIVLACDGDGHKDERLIVSRDNGKTWTVAKGDMRATAGRYVIHPAIALLSDGSLLAFLRGPNPLPAMHSNDLGATWKEVETPFPGLGTGQKSAALRLQSGALLLCSPDSKKKLVGGGTFAALSLDDGKTWPHVRKVPSVGGYMSVAQADDGTIYLVGSRLTAAAFNEAWLKEAK
ncbi:MAG: SUMF1/EgtB/PvdO family nonheme iron enzyme [Gemmataceae bacterium]